MIRVFVASNSLFLAMNIQGHKEAQGPGNKIFIQKDL
jgi:hypothetical protein